MESHVDSNNGSIQRIALGLGQWQSHSDKLDQDFVGQLQRLMLSDLSREESFLVKYQQNDRRLNNKSYHFDVKLKVFDDDVVANLSLIHSQSNTVKEIFTVTEPMSDASGAFDSIEVMEALSKQMTTAVRVALLHSRWFKSYRGALEEYSYEDLELLIHAREYSYNYNPGVRDSSKKILQTLKQKYPNNPYPYGIEGLSYVFTMDMYRDRWSNIHQPMFELTQKTLQLDPSNADALIALFHYNYHYAGARHKVDKVVQDLLHYHPHDQHAWRTKLFLMIKSAQPCEDIRGFIGEMPAGVFKPIRIQVIKRILATCLDGADVNQLLTVHSDSSRSKQAELRAIMNNLYLFEVRHDNLAEVYTLKYKNKTKGRYLAEHYAASLQMGDQLRTQALSYEINKVAAGFELWLANLYAELYQMEPFSDHDVFAINDYRFIERFSDLNLAAALIQDMRRNNDKNKLQHYLEERPVFDVNMINRYESIARMMVLYANGDIEHSRRIAVKLYNLFESYRVNNQKSYYFYNMGRFQLLAAFYCGSVCAAIDTVDAQTRLDSWFAQNHIWWFDDQQFTKIVLSFWPEHPLVRAYLERISQDKLRLKDKLGF